MAATTPAPSAMRREVTLTRTFAAPRALVYQAFTDAKHLAQWWGPHGFSTPVCECDVRPGGTWYLVMKGHGMEHPMRAVFHEVEPPARLVFTCTALDQQGQALLEAHTTITLTEHEGQNTLTLHAVGVGLVPQAPQMLAGMEIGWGQSLDRLAALATDLDARAMAHVRVFPYPPATVWAAFADPARLAQWWGPAGFRNTIQVCELHTGGNWQYIMHGPNGADYPNESVFTLVVPAVRLEINHLRPMHQFDLLLRFTDLGGATQLDWVMTFPTPAGCAAVRPFVPRCNEENLDRLAADLAAHA